MNDRELLELAAKAAGWDLVYNETYGTLDAYLGDDEVYFNFDPLNDDADAFRLAVKLRLTIEVSTFWISVWKTGGASWTMEDESASSNQLTETRRAIVRAAAEIGRQMS